MLQPLSQRGVDAARDFVAPFRQAASARLEARHPDLKIRGERPSFRLAHFDERRGRRVRQALDLSHFFR